MDNNLLEKFEKLVTTVDQVLEKNDYLEKKVEQLVKTIDQHEFKIQELLLLLRKSNNSNTTTNHSGASNSNNTNSPPISPRTSSETIGQSTFVNSNNGNNGTTSTTTSSAILHVDFASTTSTTNTPFVPFVQIEPPQPNNVNNNISPPTPPPPPPMQQQANSSTSSPNLSPISSPNLSSRPRISLLGASRGIQSAGNLNIFKKEDSSESLLKYSKDGETIYIAPTTPRPSKSPSMDFISSSPLVNSTLSGGNCSTINEEINTAAINNNITTEDELPQLPNDNKCQWAIIWEYNATDDEWVKGLIAVELEPKPFAKGSLRNAYQLKIRMNPMKCFNHFSSPIHEKYQSGKKLNVNEIPKLTQTSNLDTLYVAKDSKTTVGYERYFEDVKMQMICKSYADRYNGNHPPKKIEFLSAWVIEIQGNPSLRGGNRNSGSNTLYGLEFFMKGEFKKQNSNYGSVLSDRNTPQTFSHYTYECTAHEMLVVDIQGVDDIYTDPQIHTRDGKGYGEGNLGEKGMQQFLRSHKCTPICIQFGLPSIGLDTGRNSHRVVRGTMLLPDLLEFLHEPEYPTIESIPTNTLQSELFSIGSLSFHNERVCSLLVNSDKSILYSASADGNICIWNLVGSAGTGTVENDSLIGCFRGHRKSIEKMVLNDQYLFTASTDGTIKVWDILELKRMATPTTSTVSILDCKFKLEDHTAEVNDLCIDVENNVLVSCSFDKSIKIWDLLTMKCVKSLNGHGKSVKSIYLSGGYLFSSSNDQSIKIWDMMNMMCIYGMSDAHDSWITSLRMYGDRFFSASKSGEIKEWNISTFLPSSTLDENHGAVTDILVTSNGYLFIASDDSTIKICDLSNGTMKIINSTKAHRSGVASLATDNKRLFSGGCDNLIKIWQWRDKQ